MPAGWPSGLMPFSTNSEKELKPVKSAQFIVHQGHVREVPKTEQGANEEDGGQQESLVLGSVRTLHHTTAMCRLPSSCSGQVLFFAQANAIF